MIIWPSVHTWGGYDVNQVCGNYDVMMTRDHPHTWVAVTSSRCGNGDTWRHQVDEEEG